MPGHGQRQFVRGDAAAVVADTDQPHAAFFKFDVHARGAGIKCVFDQFFDHRRGPLDDFAGSDLVDQHLGQLTDRHQRVLPCWKRKARRIVGGKSKTDVGTAIRRRTGAVIKESVRNDIRAGQRLPPATVPTASASACARAANNVPGGGWRVKKVSMPSSTAAAILRW